MRKLILRIRNKIKEYGAIVIFMARSMLHARELKCVQNNTARIKNNDLILFSTLRNEAFRMPHFLKHYRKLGINHFICVDNGSSDDFQKLVHNDDDVSVWYTESSYKKSAFGMHWLNHLLRKYGTNHWCMVCDPDELLVFPYSDQRNLHELTEYLDNDRKNSFFCLLLDMYSDVPVQETRYRPDSDPLDFCSYFDTRGYVQRINHRVRNVWVQGGPRRRIFYRDKPEKAPALNKTPLVKWKWHYSYISSMHALVPRYLNIPHGSAYLSPTGCLLHFKFFSILTEKATEELARKEHFNASHEYEQYSKHLSMDSQCLMYEGSDSFKDWRQLVQLGLMSIGRWF